MIGYPYDGDEMNVFTPLSTYTAVELRKMVHVPTQIITPQSNKPVMGGIMDTVVGASHITMDGIVLTLDETADILGNVDSYKGKFRLEPPLLGIGFSTGSPPTLTD